MPRSLYSVQSIRKSFAGHRVDHSTASEYDLNWRSIIFIPFGDFWQFVINASIVANSFWVIYFLGYQTSMGEAETEWFHYCMEFLFLLDTLLCITYRNMPRYHKIRDHIPKKLTSLIFDVGTLLPLNEVYFLLLNIRGADVRDFEFRQVIRIKSALRLYRFPLYISKMKSQAGRNQIFIIWLSHFVTVGLSVHVLAAIWYNMGCWKCEEENWTNALQRHIFDASSVKEWFFIAYTNIGITFQHYFRGILRPVKWDEQIVIMITMLAGYFSHIIYFFGQLTIGRIKQLRRQLEYSRRVSQIKKTLEEWDVKKDTKEMTIKYYSTLWSERSGIKEMPECFNLLPAPMQKEVTLDIFWDALKHATLFKDVEMPFKRAISLVMKSEFYLPGDYIYKIDHDKTKMVYIVSGILQLTSDEDEESPVMSFSAGTVLGETSLVFPTKSKANLRCATNCELHTLSASDLGRALYSYPQGIKKMKDIILERIEHAKDVLDVKESVEEDLEESGFATYHDDNSILWMKARWKQLYQIKLRKKAVDLENLRSLTDIQHTSVNLGLLALSEDVEPQIKAICLSATCPYIFEPNSTFMRFCNALILFAVTVQSVVLPYFVCFERRIPPILMCVMFVFDCIYFFDIYLQLSTVVKGRIHTINTISSIVLYKFKQTAFLVDVIAFLPLDYIGYYSDISDHAEALLRLNRLLKLHMLFAFIKTKEKDLMVDYLRVQLVKYILIYLFIIYWCTCFLYAVACFYEECYEYGWFRRNMKWLVEAGYVKDPNKFVFTRSLLYTVSIIFAMKQNAIIEWVTHEKVILFALLNVTYYLYTFCFSELCATMVQNNQHRLNYKDYIKSMNLFLFKNQVNRALRQRVARLLTFRWEYNENVTVLGKNGILSDAPMHIKDRVVLKRVTEGLNKSLLFQDCDQEFLHCVAENAVLKTLPPGGEVAGTHIKSSWIHVILRGYCEQKSFMTGDSERENITVLKPGDAFPVVEALSEVLVLASVTAVTAVELISIRLADLKESMQRFPFIRSEFIEALVDHRSLFETQLLRKKVPLPAMIPLPKKSLGHEELLEYYIYNSDEINDEVCEFKNPLPALGLSKCIKYIFLRRSVNPMGRFFFAWEIIRTCMAIFFTVTAFAEGTVFTTVTQQLRLIYNLLVIIKVLDLYIRMHCQYYNNMKILVTHPWSTAKHYLSTSFSVDLISYFPAEFFGTSHVFGTRYSISYILSVFFSMLCRPLQMHRFFSLLTYFQSNIHNQRAVIIQAIKYSVLVFIVTAVSAALLVSQICVVSITGEVSCKSNRWITNTHFKDKLTPVLVFLLSLALPFNFFSLTGGTFVLVQIDEILLSLPIVFILHMLRWYILAKLTSIMIRENLHLTIFHEQVVNFQQFMKKEMIDEDLVTLTIQNYQYVWKKTQGTEVSKSLAGFHAHLHEDLGFDLYANTLRRTEFFYDAEKTFFRLMGVQVREMYFKKDAEIIRCNDVQGLVYIVYKGKVDVTVARMKLCTLECGGMFGSFKGKAKTRQTIAAVAKVHVGVLAVDGIEFNKIVSQYPSILMKVKKSSFLNAEFVEPHGTSTAYEKDSDETMSRSIRFSSTTRGMSVTSVRSVLGKIGFAHLRIDETDKQYRLFNYLVSVHLAALSSLWYSFVVAMLPLEDQYSIWLTLITAIIIDLIFVMKMFAGCHLTYIDPESGILITKMSLIRKRYFCSLLRFWFDLVTVLPLNIIFKFTVEEYLRYGYINRIFRWFYLFMYYKQEEEDLNVKIHLRWTYLIYTMLFYMQIAACLWFVVACRNFRCYYNISPSDSNEIVVKAVDNLQQSVLLTYNHVINILTTNAVKTTVPLNEIEIVTTILTIVILMYATIQLISGFTTIMAISSYSMGNYEFNIDGLRIYLQDGDLSPFLLHKVWKYCVQLWQRQRGEHMPLLVTEAPPYIRQDIMLSLYGSHIETHFLFAKTHTDFIRQLVVHLKRRAFFPGNPLAEKGDADGCMYFIHDGEVDVYDVHGEDAIPRELLRRGRSFGEASGLYNAPHDYTYRARTVVDALLLKYRDWEYLMDWFPASKEEIFEKAVQFHVKRRKAHQV